MRQALAWLVAVWSVGAWAGPAPEWHRVVGLLEYLEGDYPAAQASRDADELAEQRGLADEVVTALEALGHAGAPFVERAKAVRAAIDSGASGEAVAAQCHALVASIVAAQGLSRAPRVMPELGAGQALFAAHCATCHGVEGRGDGPAAAALTPRPADFHDVTRMRTLTPYKAFNTTTFGIPGTPMPGFAALSDADRWSLAFFLFTLRQPPCAGAPPGLSLEALATSSDDQLAAAVGAQGVACARRALAPPAASASLRVAREGLEAAQRLARAGDWDGARTAVVDAYLLGLEPIEPTLRARDPKLVDALERGFTRTRLAAQQRRDFEPEVGSLLALLAEPRPVSQGDFWSVFVAALVILLREGFEAVVVVGALLAVMKKLQAGPQVRVVHLGWVAALVVGALAFVFGQSLLAGARREWVETVVALLAVGLLLYAALWLNARAQLSAFMGELRGRMTHALGRHSTLGLFTIAFTSVGRETLETAVFLQGLAQDSRAGVSWGVGVGAALLIGLVVFVKTVGFKLPMKALFNASTVLLVATAVMLLGKGLHGLQELGVLPLAPAPLVTIDALGVYADWLTFGPQALLALGPLAWVARRRQRATAPAGASSARS